MTVYDLQKTKKNLFEILPISTQNVTELDEANDLLCAAENVHLKYKKMVSSLEQLDKLTDDINIGTHEFDMMSEEDHEDDLDHSSIDAIHILKAHVKFQEQKFRLYCLDLEATIEALQNKECK